MRRGSILACVSLDLADVDHGDEMLCSELQEITVRELKSKKSGRDRGEELRRHPGQYFLAIQNANSKADKDVLALRI
jgi:hypothetical protein